MDKMDTELVSIIIPIYKVSEYLDVCVQSACNQTYQNIEIILVDDGSPDDCPEKCDSWGKRDSRIKVIHKSNGGLSDARNAGLDAAFGKYIYFLDGDDYIEHDLLEKALSHMSDNVDMVFFGRYQEYSNNCIEKKTWESGIFDISIDVKKCRYIIEKLLQSRVGWEAWGRIFRRDVIERFNLRFEDNKKIFAEDLYFCLCYCAHSRKIIGITNCLYHYRIRESSIMGKDSIKLNVDRMNELSKAVKRHYKKFDDCKALLNVYPIIHYLIIDNVLKRAIRNGMSMRELRKRVYFELQDKEFFILHLKKACLSNQMFYETMDAWNATDRLNTCKYLIDGSYNKLRIRNRMLHYYPEYYELKSAKIKGIDAACRNFAKNKKKIYIIGTEEYGNVGDHQIAEAICNYLKTVFPEYMQMEITIRTYQSYKAGLKKYIKPEDLIVLTGGGNVGDVYLAAHNLRSDVIRNWPVNTKIIFPQTIFFKNFGADADIFNQCKELFTYKNNVTLFTREKTSFEFAQKHFNCDSFLAPDIVLSMNLQAPIPRKRQVLLCFRSDEEKSVSQEITEQIELFLQEKSISIQKTDLQLDYWVEKINRKTEIAKKISLWQESCLVITDRLHGMVFAAITGTPCIVFSNYNHKVRGTYEWIKYLPYICYAKSIEDVQCYFSELLAMENCKFDNTPLLSYYEEIAEVMRQHEYN